MPVRKYRSVEDMEDAFWTSPGTPGHHRAVQAVLDAASFFAGERPAEPGVYKFHSMEEACAQREIWDRRAASGRDKPPSVKPSAAKA